MERRECERTKFHFLTQQRHQSASHPHCRRVLNWPRKCPVLSLGGGNETSRVLGGAMAWPLTAHAQQSERTRRIGVLMLYPENDPQGQIRAKVFGREFERLGWNVGGNLQITYHWGTGNADWV